MVQVKKLIDIHQDSINILEGVDHFVRLIKINEESIKGYSRMFPNLVEKYNDNIEIYNKCKVRLLERHKALQKKITTWEKENV
jgi:hypothetical protein